MNPPAEGPREPNRLRWEAGPGTLPRGVGICLSGGGLRASSFSLGVLQALQEERGLLFGPRSADYLAVVSGGSYVGASHCLTATALGGSHPDQIDLPPLAEGSAEASHVMSHGRYLVEDGWPRTVARFAVPAVLNIAALGMLFTWIGFMVADFAWIAEQASSAWNASWLLPPNGRAGQWFLAAIAMAGGALALRNLSKDGGIKRYLVSPLALAVFFATATSLVARMQGTLALSTPSWWQNLRWLLGWVLLALIVVLASVWWTLSPPRSGAARLGTKLLGIVAVSVPRAIGFLLLSFTTVAMARVLQLGTAEGKAPADEGTAGIVLASTLIGGALASAIPNRVSLHRLYRKLLARCFAIRRDSGAPAGIHFAEGAFLSHIAPPKDRPAMRFPRLLVCATANVRWRDPQGRRRSFAPFVFSHDRCGVPGVDNAWFETEKLELGRVPTARPRGREPLLSLMSSVSMAGAALSPSMGSKTLPMLRPLIAAINLRTGAWMPNPLSARVRRRVARMIKPGRVFRDRGLGGGFDQLVPEMFGIQSADGRQVYVTDGGHYDNLGLTALLQARCSEIWCVDSEPDKRGKVRQLQHIQALAKEDLGIDIEIELGPFRFVNGCVASSFAQGLVRYPEGSSARLVVIKLGLPRAAPKDLWEYKSIDPRFPYHATALQWYNPPRTDAYRRLGLWAAKAFLSPEEVRTS